jgi:hypothetical protein
MDPMKYIYRNFGNWRVEVDKTTRKSFPFQEDDGKIAPYKKDTKNEALRKARKYRNEIKKKELLELIEQIDNDDKLLNEEEQTK